MNHSAMFFSQKTFMFHIVNSNTFVKLQNLYSRLIKKHPTKKVEFLEIISSKNWDNLKEKRTKHSLTDGKE